MSKQTTNQTSSDKPIRGTALAEMGIFVGLLAFGLLYAWRKRVLTWE